MNIHSMIWCVIAILSLHTGFAQTSANGTTTETTTPKSLTITATPQRTWVSHFNSDCGTSSRCKRMSLKSLKKEQWANAVAYAASGLDMKVSKRNSRKLLAVLTQTNYDKVKAAFIAKKTELEAKTVSYQGVEGATYMYNLRWYALRFAILNQLIKTIENPTKITLYPVTADDLEGLRRKLDDFSNRASEEYFTLGEKTLTSAKTKDDYKMAFHYLAIATQYNSKHPKAAELAEHAKSKAVTSMYIASSRYANNYNKVGFALDEEIRSALFNHSAFKGLAFFAISSQKNKAEYELRTIISKYHVQDLGQETKQQTYKKQVSTGKKDANGKDITTEKISKVSIYTRTHVAESFVNWEIVERKSGQVVAAGETKGTFTWRTIWAVGNNPEIVPSKVRKLMERKRDKKPSNLILYQKAIKDNARPLVTQILQRFIVKHGKGLDQ